MPIFIPIKLFLQKNFFWLLAVFFGFTAAFFIVYYPAYFFIALSAFLLLAVLAWKTEASFFALIFYLPFQIALNVSSGVDMASGRLLILVFFLIWLVKSLAAKKLDIPCKNTTWLIFSFLGLVLVSVIFSIDQDRSWVRALYFLSIMPIYFLAADYLNSFLKIKKAIFVLLSSAFLASVIGLVQFLSQFYIGIDPVMNFLAKNIAPVFYGQSFSETVLANPSWLVNIGGATFLRAISLFPDPHVLAFYLGLIIPLALSLFLFAGNLKFSGKTKALILLVNFVLLAALAAAFSRAGYIGAFFGIATIILLGWKFLDKRIKLAMIAIVFIGGVSALNFSSVSAGLVFQRFLSSFNLSEGSNSERIINWNRAVKIISDSPLTGVGVGAYSYAVDPRSPAKSAITAHNAYLDIAAEMGLGALLVWLLLLGVTIKKLAKIFFSKDNSDRDKKIVALGLIGSFVWFSVQAVFDTAIYSPALFAILMIYFAMSVNLEEENTHLNA